MRDRVIMDLVGPKLLGKDAVVFSTLSKYASTRSPCEWACAVLDTIDNIVSFGKWIRRHASTLHVLDIRSYDASSRVIGYLCMMCRNLYTLKLDLMHYDVFAFGFMDKLENLELALTHSIDDGISLESVVFPKLQSLKITSSSVENVSLPSSIPVLTSLRLQRAKIDRFSQMPHLREMQILHCIFPEESLDRFTELTRLEYLDVEGCRFEYLPEEFGSLVNLRTLLASNNALINYEHEVALDDTLRSIQNLVNLTHLDISHNYIDDVGMEASLPLLNCPSLQSLDVACNPCHDLPEGSYLRGLTSLRTSILPSRLDQATKLQHLHLHEFCHKHSPMESIVARGNGVRLPDALDTVYIDDTHVSSRLMEGVLTMIRNRPSIGTHFVGE